jgi:hypothetical protein
MTLNLFDDPRFCGDEMYEEENNLSSCKVPEIQNILDNKYLSADEKINKIIPTIFEEW